MPFRRGIGFRGGSPPWPYVGLGRGGLPRCWAYAPFWGAPYAYPYGTGAYPPGWGTGFSPMYPYGYPTGYTYGPSPWEASRNRKEEKEWLKSQADLIRQEIDQINRRITELEKE
jgi:hypothetical protein